MCIRDSANIHIEQILTAGSQKSVQCAMLSLSVTNPKTKGFVDLLVLTLSLIHISLDDVSENEHERDDGGQDSRDIPMDRYDMVDEIRRKYAKNRAI